MNYDEALKAVDYITSNEFLNGKLYYKNGEHFHPAQEMVACHPAISDIRSALIEAARFRKAVEAMKADYERATYDNEIDMEDDTKTLKGVAVRLGNLLAEVKR